MGMKGNNFFEAVLLEKCIQPQTVTSATVNGATIAEPWRKGRQISFIAQGGTFATNANGQLKLQGQKRSDGTYANLLDKDGNVLEFDATILDDAGALEAGIALGTVDFGKIDVDTYKGIRVVFIESGGGAMLIGVVGVISDLIRHPSNQTDYLFSKLT